MGRIIVIEDNIIYSDYVCRLLENKGFHCYDKIRLVAPTNMSVLIQGESGTGKEHIAEKIHVRSKRSGKPFKPVDCYQRSLPHPLCSDTKKGRSREPKARSKAFGRKPPEARCSSTR